MNNYHDAYSHDNIGITFHMRGRKDDSVTIDDAYEVAQQGIYYVQSLLTLISLVDTEKYSRRVRSDNDEDYVFDHLGRVGVMMLSASLTLFEELNEERKEGRRDE